jgi:putative nucleotidyltransferase with HDIG domain
MIGTVFSTRKPHVIRNLKTDKLIRTESKDRLPANHGGACVPIQASGHIIGVLFISVERPRLLAEHEVDLLATLAEMAGNAIQRMRLFQRTQAQLERMTALNSIERAIAASFDLHVTLNILLEQLLPRLNADAASVLLLQPQLQQLEYAAGRGFRTRRIEHVQVGIGNGLIGRALMERRILGINNLKQSPAPQLRQPLVQIEEFVAYYVAPLIAKGEIKGALEIFTRHPLNPDPEWIEFLESLSLQAATAIDNAQLLNGLQRTNLELAMAYDATIEGWAHALDLRDKETEGHTRRVANMTVDLARALRFSEQDLIHVRRGALLHDIGKMAIPDRILHKNASLTGEEWEIMRMHPTYAYQMLSPIIHLRESLDIPYCHHERWDGSGYPRGLKYEDIPVPARIFAVVDVWDALRSDRPYRPSWSLEKTRAYLLSQRGIQFEPAVLDTFIRLMEEKEKMSLPGQ